MSDTETLHDFLLRDFEIDLPIHGGTGNKASPVVVTSPTLQEAVDVQMQVLRCLGIGRRIAWRVIEQEVVQSADKTVRVGIETIRFTEWEVEIQRESCYFVLDALRPEVTACRLPMPPGFSDLRSGITLPYQLGWVHLESVTDNEPQFSGLGSTVYFGGLAIKATVYVYASTDPPPTDANVESDRVIEEFRRAVIDALRINEGSTILSSRLVGGSSAAPSFALAVLEQPAEHMSWVLLSPRNGFFVKGRITCVGQEARVHRMAHESIVALMNEIHPEAAITVGNLVEAEKDIG